jgi:N-carbamoyl-L-amino-acid hydrolase
MDLARIGAYTDERTGLVGVNRLALTDADAAARRQVIRWMEEAGLSVRIDAVGNVYGRRSGSDPSAAPVMIGSHIDSVAAAGAFDGCLGVLGGLEVVRRFDELGLATTHPIEVAFFTEEEGVRFRTDMLGSAVAVGRVPLDQALALMDRSGATLGSELARHGFDGPGDPLLSPPHAYLECHIEQGPVLAAADQEIGVVTGVQGISWQEVTIDGRAGHAGATPTDQRADAGLAAARAVVHLRAMADSDDFGSLRATVGGLHLHPGLPNVVPSRATFTVDLRNPDDAAMDSAETALGSFLHGLEAEHEGRLTATVERLALTRAVDFDDDLQAAIATAADDLGYRHQSLRSGAGHDAQELAHIGRAAMIFVPGEHEGISHNPREYSTPDACRRGIDVLATVTARLAR